MKGNRVRRKLKEDAVREAVKVQRSASKKGFDWNDPLEALEKVLEEAEEVRKVLRSKPSRQPGRVGEEIGDLLFAVINVARLVGVNPKEALRSTVQKFQRRFRNVLKIMKEKGLYRENDKMSLTEMDAIWEKLKEKDE